LSLLSSKIKNKWKRWILNDKYRDSWEG
jgi:hypothetical protein